MARNAEQTKIHNKERYIGRKAAKMAESYVHSILKRKLDIDGNDGADSVLKKTTVRAKMGQYRLLGLNFKSNKSGFVNHYGFRGIRASSTVLLSDSRYNMTATTRKAHPFHLPERRLFDDIYRKSGAIDFLIKSLSETRTNAIKLSLNALIVQLNISDDNGN